MINNSNKQILVTTALDYANGDLHLGHILEKIQADIWVRTQKLLGNTCFFICGDDAHGTPIMLKAKEKNISPEDLIKYFYERHLRDLKAFNIGFDNFHTTHSAENKDLVSKIYKKLFEKGDIIVKEIEQLYDQVENIFLPDRYVKGQCPKCSAENQYGDNCESCGAHYPTNELKNPKSIITGTTPVIRKTEHYFFNLANYKDFLQNWLKENNKIPLSMLNKLNEWLKDINGLKPWDISRDAPYFGFLIPETQDKYFYVWLDAPIGYISIFKNLCDKNAQITFSDFFNENTGCQPNIPSTELYHFIGKDIIYFHALFWPAILHGSKHRTPTKIFAHGFLTINGEKMSKSRGTFITAKEYIDNLSSEYLRYYFATKLSNSVEDLDLNLDDFVLKVNSDLVGKFVNIASRCAAFINKYFSNKLADCLDSPDLYHHFISQKNNIFLLFIDLNYGKAIKEIMNLADQANQYIDSHKPWQLIKQPENFLLVQQVCTTGINLFKVLITYLKPVLPETSQLAEDFLNTQLNLDNLKITLDKGHVIKKFNTIISRVDLDKVQNLLKPKLVKPISNVSNEININDPKVEKSNINIPNKNMNQNRIKIEEFNKIDLRVAKIINAEEVPEANKLLKLTLDVGHLGIKQVFAGIKSAYSPNDLIGKCTVMVANLEERKMRFGVSQGMVLAASAEEPSSDKHGLWILEPHLGAEPGMRIK
jgi:methionyl-tRNA synthetase